MSLFFNPLVTRDSDGTIFEVLGEGKDYEGQPKVFIAKQGAVGWHRITQVQLWVNFTAYPAPPAAAEDVHLPEPAEAQS